MHGYPSCVRVGSGSDEIDQLDGWAGAVTPKPPINAKKKLSVTERRTDGPTDQRTDGRTEPLIELRVRN